MDKTLNKGGSLDRKSSRAFVARLIKFVLANRGMDRDELLEKSVARWERYKSGRLKRINAKPGGLGRV